MNSMTEKRFADLTVKLWRLHQRINKLQKATAVPAAITAQAVQETRKEIASTFAQLQQGLK